MSDITKLFWILKDISIQSLHKVQTFKTTITKYNSLWELL